jgi:uncharacterized protein (TIGR00255 family)
MGAARSMTGFGRATLAQGNANLTAEVSTVNQRGLAVVVHLPAEWAELETRLGAVVRESFQRGKVTVRLGCTRVGTGGPDLAEPLRHLRDLATRHGIKGEPDWHVLQRLVEQQQGIAGLPVPDETMAEAAARCLREALRACDGMRAKEGEALVRDLSTRLDAIAALVERMAASERTSPTRTRDRLLRRLADLGVGIDLADERVLRELALHADRCDITEELTRLRSHIEQGRSQLGQSAPGRGLDFLTQEFLREVNTIGSKAAEVETTRAVLEAKTEIERFREQVQNLE